MTDMLSYGGKQVLKDLIRKIRSPLRMPDGTDIRPLRKADEGSYR